MFPEIYHAGFIFSNGERDICVFFQEKKFFTLILAENEVL
jgi:hypothetical protein